MNIMIGTAIVSTAAAEPAPVETVEMVATALLKVFSCSLHT